MPLKCLAGIEAVGLVHDLSFQTYFDSQVGELEPKIVKTILEDPARDWTYNTQEVLLTRGVKRIFYQPIHSSINKPATAEQIQKAYYRVFKRAMDEELQGLILPLVIPVARLQQWSRDLKDDIYSAVIPAYSQFLQECVKDIGRAANPFPGKLPEGRIFVLV